MFFMMSIESYKNIINLTYIRSKIYNIIFIIMKKFSDIVLQYFIKSYILKSFLA